MIVEHLDCTGFAVVAGKGFVTLHNSMYARIVAVGPPLSEINIAALIAANLQAHELNVRTLAGDITAVIAYRSKCYSLRAARNIGEIVIARYDERAIGSCSAVKYLRVNNASFCFARCVFLCFISLRCHAAAPLNRPLDIARAA